MTGVGGLHISHFNTERNLKYRMPGFNFSC